MLLEKLQKGEKLVKKTKRLGRGSGSGAGAKSGRGQKGQKSRTGARIRAAFEGGQTPFIQKIPKLKGFKPLNKVIYEVVNLDDLEKTFADGATVDLKALVEKGFFKGVRSKVKVLGNGTLKKKLKVTAHKFSKSAKEAIEKAGGEATEAAPAKKKKKAA